MRRAPLGDTWWRWVVLGWFALAWAVADLVAQPMHPLPRVTRGAYLQCATSNSVVVRWRTAVATSSVVRYDLRPGDLKMEARSPGRFRDHAVLITGLSPDTKYHYGVGTAHELLQSGPLNYFITAPVAGAARPVRVWVLGDPGTGFPVQKAVRDAYLRTFGREATDLVLTLGDNAYSDGTDYQYQRGFFEIYREPLKHWPLWPALGNHDARSADSDTESGVYFDIFTLPRRGQAGGVPSGTEAYYSFTYGNAHFICLDSEDSDLSPEGEMLRWLRRDLAGAQADWIIAYWHHPPYTRGNHDSDAQDGNDTRMGEMRRRVLPLLEEAGVDLVLCGHTHLYERSYPLRGHYGNSDTFHSSMLRGSGQERRRREGPYRFGHRSATRGTIYINAGSAGHATEPKDLRGLNYPAMAVGWNLPGSLRLEIVGRKLEVIFLDERGARRDYFSISKEEEGPLRPR